jgi:hypothetical protein
MQRNRKASPTLVPFGAVIAERRLNPPDAPGRSIVVSLGKPRKTKGADDWRCPFRIDGTGIRKVEYGYGVDAFQALTMALEGIRYFLDRLDTPLVWGGMLKDHSGFQRVIPWLPEFHSLREADGTSAKPLAVARYTRRIERLVDREADRWGREMKRKHLAAKRRKTGRRAPMSAAPKAVSSR